MNNVETDIFFFFWKFFSDFYDGRKCPSGEISSIYYFQHQLYNNNVNKIYLRSRGYRLIWSLQRHYAPQNSTVYKMITITFASRVAASVETDLEKIWRVRMTVRKRWFLNFYRRPPSKDRLSREYFVTRLVVFWIIFNFWLPIILYRHRTMFYTNHVTAKT